MDQESAKRRLVIKSPEISIDDNSNLESVLQFVEAIQPGNIKEFILPKKIKFDSFLLALGNVKRSYEYGGDYDPESRKVRVTRSGTQYSAFGATGEAIKSTGFHERKDPFGKIVGSLWHTHPWATQEETYQKRYGNQYRLEMNCLPSADDNAVVFKTSLAEQVDGKGKSFLSSISASGFISETSAEGIRLDIEKLRELGCDEITIQNLLRHLTYEPPLWVQNFAKEGKAKELVSKVSAFYKKKLLFDGSFC